MLISKYNYITDPESGKKYSLSDLDGKRILNNYFKHLQHVQLFQQKQDMRGGGGGDNSLPCGQAPQAVAQQYQQPCRALPFDHAFRSYQVIGGGGKKGKQSVKRVNPPRRKGKKSISKGPATRRHRPVTRPKRQSKKQK